MSVNKLSFDMESVCKCGHRFKAHSVSKPHWCHIACFVEHPDSTMWQHPFEIDNLSYIEQEATKRNLV